MSNTADKAREELIRWTFKPYRAVFPSQGSLANVPGGLDHISKKGCRQQSLSSWACSSLSYITIMGRGSKDQAQQNVTNNSTRKCDEIDEDPQWEEDITKQAKSVKTLVYGSNPSDRFLSIVDPILKEYYISGRMYYVDHMIMTETTLRRYHTMALAEKILYHIYKLVEYMGKAPIGHTIEESLSCIMGKPRSTTVGTHEYLDKSDLYNFPPSSIKEQRQRLIMKKQAEFDDESDYQMYHRTLENALSLSRWCIKLNLRAPNNFLYTKNIDSIVQFETTNYTAFTTWSLLDFRGQRDHQTKADTRADKIGNNYCLKQFSYSGLQSGSCGSDWGGPRKEYGGTTNKSDATSEKKKIKNFGLMDQVNSIPVRMAKVTSIPSIYERENKCVPSATFNALSEKINDRGQTGSLGALVRRTVIREPASALALIKTLMGEPASALDVAPLVRMCNMMNSLDLTSVNADLTPYQFYRNYVPIDHSIHLAAKHLAGQLPACFMYLDDFIDYISGSIDMRNITGFLTTSLDKDWIAIPVNSEILESRALIPYVFSFLDSALTDGTVNWVFRGEVETIEPGDDYKQGVIYGTIPASNTFVIPGVRKFVMVLVDQHDMRQPVQENYRVEGVDIAIYNRGIPGDFEPTNIMPLRNAYYTTDHYNLVYGDYSRAYSHFMKTNLLSGVQSLAMAMVAEARNAFKPGMYLRPGMTVENPDPNNYDFQSAVGGGWFVSKSEELVATKIANNTGRAGRLCGMAGTLDAWEKYCGVLDVPFHRFMSGYNMSSLSSWHLMPNGQWQVRNADADQMIVPNIPAIVMCDTKGENNRVTTGYSISQATSLHRLATVLDLYERDDTHVKMYSAPTVTAWSHMHSISIASCMAIYLVTNNISLNMWSGYGFVRLTSFAYEKLRQIKSELFMALVFHCDTLLTLMELLGHQELALDIQLYYRMDPLSTTFWSSTPVHITLFLQWYRKVITRDYDIGSKEIFFIYNGYETLGMQVLQNQPLQRILASVSPDLTRYLPASYYQGDIKCMLGVWFEAIQMLTMALTNPAAATHRDAYQTFPTTCAPIDVLTVTVDPRRMYIVGSDAVGDNAAVLSFVTTDLEWPDPPSVPISGEYKPPSGQTITVPPAEDIQQIRNTLDLLADGQKVIPPEAGLLAEPPNPAARDPEI